MIFEHFRIKRMISSYIDGELPDKKKQLLEAHLNKCPACRRYLEELKKITSSLKKWEDEDISPDLEQKIKKDFLGDKYKGVAKMKKSKKLFVGLSSVALTILILLAVPQYFVRRGFEGRLKETSGRISGGEYFARELEKGTDTHQVLRGLTATNGITYYDAFCSDRGVLSDRKKLNFELANSSLDFASSEGGRDVGGYSGDKTVVYGAIGHDLDGKKDDYSKVSSITRRSPGASYTTTETGNIIIVEPYLPATGDEEKVIRSADVHLEVENVENIYDQVVKVGKEKGGYLAQANFSEQRTGKISARIVLRIPKDKFEDALDKIRRLGEVKGFNINSVDVCQQYAAIHSELEKVKVIYDKMVKKLEAKRTDIEGAIQMESALTPYLRRIENLRSQLANYDNLIAMSTITISLETTSWKVLWRENFKQMGSQLVNIVSGLIRFIVDALPVLLVLGLIAVLGCAIVRKIKKAVRSRNNNEEDSQ